VAAGGPDLSVIVVTHNGRELALKTLRTAIARTGPIETEWLVVDNGSSDGTADAVERELPVTRVLRRSNVGFAAGNNVGLGQARGRYVLLLNPDVEIREGTLAALVEALDRRPEVGAASVRQVSPDGAVQVSARRFPSIRGELGEALMLSRLPLARRLGLTEASSGSHHAEHSVDWLVGAFLVVRREAVDQVGPLDDRFFLYSEEKDWCLRLRQAGWDVRHLPVMTVIHHCGGYSRPELRAQLAYSRLLFSRKHLGPLQRVGYRAVLAVKHLLRAAALAPLALVQAGRRPRLRGEVAALRQTLGLAPPPFAPPRIDDQGGLRAP
jgi:N-acetylglucosaminyl-diphospho-decaprenol L-rhamnosyltransferase